MNKKKILGLILELNPPHNGHKYFIDKAKEITSPSTTIAVVSGNYTMRGDVSMINKFEKTKIALKLGIDLVLELPFLSAVNSAFLFALNSVKTLISFNITDICFGAEISELKKLNEMLTIIESNEYDLYLKKYLDEGSSYSSSSLKAFMMLTKDDELIKNFPLPNNTLALMYLKAFKYYNYSVDYHIVKRIDNNYFDKETTGAISSATSIRERANNGHDIKNFIPYVFNYINENDCNLKLYLLLKYRLFDIDISSNFGVKEGIENRLISFIDTKSFNDYLEKVKTRRYTINYLKRLILHIIMKTPKENENSVNNYLRVLGFNTIGENFIRKLDKETKKQIITTLKNRNDEISIFELKASKLYSYLTNDDELYKNEFLVPYKGE